MSDFNDLKNKICSFFYELALWLTLSFLILIPIHTNNEEHVNIHRNIDSNSVAFSLKDTSSLKPGQNYPVYRFHQQFTSILGYLTIASINNKEIIASYDPNTFKWPMGRHGQVLDIQSGQIKVAMGSNLGFRIGDRLNIFKERIQVGQVQLIQVNQENALGSVVYLKANVSKEELIASEYTVATQVVIVRNHSLFLFEALFMVFILGFFIFYYCFKGESIFYLIGRYLKSAFNDSKIPNYSKIMTILVGVPFIWFMVNFLPRCVMYVLEILIHWFNLISHSSIVLLNGMSFYYQNILSFYILGAAIYLIVYIFKEKSPIILLWDWLGFKNKSNRFIKGFWRDILIWSLHLLIFYAFGNTLWGFLNGNLNTLFHIIWPSTKISWYQINLSNQLPSVKALNFQECSDAIRYILWSVTIVGCLIGYGASVFGYLWGKRIRNLDFTPMGWLTNAICYGPLLGSVMIGMTPNLVGSDPIVTQGPMLYLSMFLETLLNLLYTLTIWNLGILFGVMTDKGVRTTGFYSVVRHPSYTLESLMFVMIYLSGFSTPQQWLTILNISMFAYYIRSEREDQFMAASNPQYVDYQRQTPYKFIPGVY